VHCGLKAARQCLAKLIAGHKQAFATRCASGVKVGLLWIGPIVSQPILS
jgi:hypothetical protein